ncbi:hypothetical protein ZWY2020_021063 [Hordeum vulgare]|nr:hypothetical protein ZWY2020_021063 [Hordeum vulgare]
MLRRLCLRGHSSFFVLADPAPSDPSSPTILLRLSRGLLARAAASRAHDLLFAPRAPLHRHPRLPTPDALTLAEPLLDDLDAFVPAMDEISGGAFLRAVPSGAGACPTCGGPAGRERPCEGSAAPAGGACLVGLHERSGSPSGMGSGRVGMGGCRRGFARVRVRGGWGSRSERGGGRNWWKV